jgi:oligopeptide/dipeptide ABC transporter ATP-binding protein
METGPVETVLAQPAHPYTLGLINSVPQAKDSRRHLAAIPGMPPDPLDLPPGCRFAPRCALASHDCTREQPSLRALATDHATACIYPQSVVRGDLSFAS